MVATYSWTCTICNSWNPTSREVCSRCACPLDATSAERNRHKIALASGERANPGNNESHVPIEEMCPQCGHKYNQFIAACKNCGREFWCLWQPEWYKNPLTVHSLGQSKQARRTGNAFVAIFVAFYLYSVLVYWLASSTKDDWLRLIFLGPVILYGSYEVWAFTHGRRTSIDHFTHEATPGNTSLRALGLAFDLLFTLGAAYLVLS
jgi:hypothetical protein